MPVLSASGASRAGLTRLRERVENAMRARLAADAAVTIFAQDDIAEPLAQVAGLAPGARALVAFETQGEREDAARLRDACDAHGLRIDAAVPTALLFGSLVPQRRLAGTACAGYAWDNLLSWAAHDEAFGDCIVFLETELLAALPLAASDRAMVVLANVEGSAHNAAWSAAQSTRAKYLAGGLTREAFAYEDAHWEQMCAVLSRHLAYEPNVAFVHRLLSVANSRGWSVRIDDFLEASVVSRLEGYLRLHDADSALNTMVAALYADPHVSGALQFENVNIGLPLDYDAIVDLTAALLPQLPSRVRT